MVSNIRIGSIGIQVTKGMKVMGMSRSSDFGPSELLILASCSRGLVWFILWTQSASQKAGPFFIAYTLGLLLVDRRVTWI